MTSSDSVKVKVIVFAMRLIARLSLKTVQRIGGYLGALIWLLRLEPRRITETNVGLCFPELDLTQQQWLSRQSLMETGRTVLEIPWMWERPIEQCLNQIVEIEGQALVDDALASGKGLVLLAPHLGNWELAGLYFSSRFAMAALYRPPKRPMLEDYMRRVRGRAGSELVPTDKKGVLRLFSILRDGGVVGILPDQEPPFSGGEFAPFFGQDCLTMKLVSKLVSKTGALALCTYARRLPNGAGYRLVIKRVDPALYDEDLLRSVAGLNRSVADCVRDVPAQYQWEYKRFKRRRPGQAHFYDKGRVW